MPAATRATRARRIEFGDCTRPPHASESPLEHDPEKACPGLDPGWKPVFEKDHAQSMKLDHDPIQLNWITV
jgi:hypothetical protein